MELDEYSVYWKQLSPLMLSQMNALRAAVSAKLPEGFGVTEPTENAESDEFAVSMGVRHAACQDEVLGLDFKLLDSDMHGGEEGAGVALAMTGYGGLVMGGYYPGNYTPDAFSTDINLLLQRVESLPIERMAVYVVQGLENPYLADALREGGISFNRPVGLKP